MQWITLVAAAAGAIVALAGAAAVLWRIIRPHVRQLVLDVTEAKESAQVAANELTPDGWCRDAITRLDGRISELSTQDRIREAELEAIKAGVSYTGRALDNVARSLDRLERTEKI